MPKQGKRLRVLTWHVHGNYLWYLTHTNVDFYLPVKLDTHGSFLPGYNGRGDWPLGNNVRDIPAEQVQHEKFDCVLFQNRQNYLEDQYALLTPEQRALPRIYLEHDTPWESPTEQRHWVDGDDLLLVHVTPFNALMWDAGRTPTRIIEHGVPAPKNVHYTGELARGISVVNHLARRGRRLGADVFERVRRDVPIDLVGMAAEELGGVGEVPPPQLAAFEAKYRFFFQSHPLDKPWLGGHRSHDAWPADHRIGND